MARTLFSFAGLFVGILFCLGTLGAGAAPALGLGPLAGETRGTFEPEALLDVGRPAETRRPGLTGRPPTGPAPDQAAPGDFVRDLTDLVHSIPTAGIEIGTMYGGGLGGLLLTDEQRLAVGRIIEAARARLEDLYLTPADDGRTWVEALNADQTSDVLGQSPLDAHLGAFVPGTAETFAEAAARIRAAAIADAEQHVPEDRRDAFRSIAEEALGGQHASWGTFQGCIGYVEIVRDRIDAIS